MNDQASEIARLYTSAKKCRGTYDQKKQRWQDLHNFAKEILNELPFDWKPVSCDNPSNNQGGISTGKTHVVLNEDIVAGKTKRKAGDALCKSLNKFNGNLFGDGDLRVDCIVCLKKAESIVKNRTMTIL